MEKVVHEIDAKKVTDHDKKTACRILIEPENMGMSNAYKRIKELTNGNEVTREDIVKLYTDKNNPLMEYRKYKDDILPSDEPTNTWINEKDEQFANMSGASDQTMKKWGNKQMMSYLYVYKNLTKFRVSKWVDEYSYQMAIGIIDWRLQDKISDMLDAKLENNIPNPNKLISIKELSLKWNIPIRRIVLYLKNYCLPSTWCNEFEDLNYLSPMGFPEQQLMRSEGKGHVLEWHTSNNWNPSADKINEKRFIPLSGVKAFEMKAKTIQELTPDPNAVSQANIDNTHVYRMLHLLIDKVEDIERKVVYKF
tara:strand:- start:1217 stop:2140 length:924 start_codon:yes stop_codon:yes gene_type:complete